MNGISDLIAFLLLLVPMISGQGGNRLLDYVSTDLYWQSQGQTVSVETMKKNLKLGKEDVAPLLNELASADPDVRERAYKTIVSIGAPTMETMIEATKSSNPELAAASEKIVADIRSDIHAHAIKRLLSIRAMGELNDPAAIPILEPLLKSEAPFEAEYAQRALDVITKKPLRQIDPASRLADVGLFPADARTVAQLNFFNNAIQLSDLIHKTGPINGTSRDRAIKHMSNFALHIAKNFGDFRIDSVNFALSGELDEDKRGFIIGIRGQFDRKMLEAFIRGEYRSAFSQDQTEVVGDVWVMKSGENRVVLVDDHYAFFVAGAWNREPVLQKYIQCIAAGKPDLGVAPEFKPLLENTLPAQRLWGVSKITDDYARFESLAAFEQIRLSTSLDEKAYRFSLVGEAKENSDLNKSVQLANQLLLNIRRDISRDLDGNVYPDFVTIRNFFAGMKCVSEKNQTKISADFDRKDVVSMSLVVDLFLGFYLSNMQ